MLTQITDETRRMLELVDLLQGDTFESIFQEVISACTAKAGDLLGAERTQLYFLDRDAREFWTYHRDDQGRLRELRIPDGSGIASAVLRAGKSINIADLSSAEDYDPLADGARSRTLLASPVVDSRGNVFAVVELSNKRDAQLFDRSDEERMGEFTEHLGLILESWWRMGCNCRSVIAGLSQAAGCASSSH